jgi:hypothetical protein
MARSSTPPSNIPLGSLTQHGARGEAVCAACGSERVTHLAMTLTDGTPVEFVSCHRCEHKTWRDVRTDQSVQPDADTERASGRELGRDLVLDKTRKLPSV